MPIDPGTLSGYDQLLSISQEAINRQLKVLYLTEVDPPLKDGPKHLINHELNIHFQGKTEDGETFVEEQGLDAYVCCPQVEFGGQSINDETDKYRLAVIRFKFRKAEEWEVSEEDRSKGRREDSIFVYESYEMDKRGRKQLVYPEVVINGWEMSWVVLIDKKDIQNVLEDIINPAESKHSNISLNLDVKKKLKGVDSANFQVSTIFCAMQSARLIQSFKLLDNNGNKPTQITNSNGKVVPPNTLIDKLADLMTRKFAHSDSAAHEPTPDNPFVLGYTISQTKAGSDNSDKERLEYFVPEKFRCNLSPASVYSGGTLNYCMLTDRLPGDRKRVVDDGVDGAGRFKQNVFERMKSKAQPGSCEGGLFFAQDIFVNQWIANAVAPRFYLGPQTVAQHVSDLIEKNYQHLNMKGRMTFGSEIREPSKPTSASNVYEMTNSFSSGRKIIAKNAFDDPTESMKLEYNTQVRVSYENVYPLCDSDEDLKRRLKLTVGSYTFIKVRFFRRLATSHVADAFSETFDAIGSVFTGNNVKVPKMSNYEGDSKWEDAYDANIWLNYKHNFEVGTSATNKGSFEIFKDKSHSEHLNSSGQLEVHDAIPPDSEHIKPGLWRHHEMHGWAATFSGSFENEMNSLSRIDEEVGKEGVKVFSGALDDLVRSLGSTVILPAGDVFMFKGLSTDEFHNVFTTISYDTPIGGTVQKKENKEVSNSWQVPYPPDSK